MRLLAFCFVLTISAAYEAPKLNASGFFENFNEDPAGKWVTTTNAEYSGTWLWKAPTVDVGIEGDMGLILNGADLKSAIQVPIDPPFEVEDHGGFVVQYEVKAQQPLQCGGAYIKLLPKRGAEMKEFGVDTDYIIMFGPDRCGQHSDKMHFILRFQDPVTGAAEEKVMNVYQDQKDNTLRAGLLDVMTDKKTHLYTLIIREDNTFEILIDLKTAKTGHLLQDMTPPIQGPKEILDPTDRKPVDREEEAQGPWVQRTIHNPEWFSDPQPYKLPPIHALGIEIFSLQDGIAFDNFYLGSDPEAAKDYALKTWAPKFARETKIQDLPSWRLVLDEVFQMVVSRPLPFNVTLLIGIVTVMGMAYVFGEKEKTE